MKGVVRLFPSYLFTSWPVHLFTPSLLHRFWFASELDAEGGEELLDIGPDGLEVLGGLDVDADVERVCRGGCQVADGLVEGADEGSQGGDDGGCGLEGAVCAGDPLEGVLGPDLNALFNAYENACHDNSLSVREGG